MYGQPVFGSPGSFSREPRSQRVGFFTAVAAGWRGSFRVNARSTRAEFGWWTLFGLMVQAVPALLSFLVAATVPVDSAAFPQLLDIATSLGTLSGFVLLAMLPATISIAARRFHDMGKSGWQSLLLFVPLLNLVVVIMLLVGKPDGPNDWWPHISSWR